MEQQANIEVVYNETSVLSEGPVYDKTNNELVWVDIEGRSINFLNLTTKTNRSIKTDDRVGAAVPCRSGDKLIASVGRRLVLIDRQTGAVLKELASVEDDKLNTRINDSKCDRKGRYWFGTMALEDESGMTPPKQGGFYSFNGVNTKQFLTDVSISNGIAFSPDYTKMYYIDSLTQQISSFNYDEQSGMITNRKVVIDLKKDVPHALPDGMTIDSEGKLWIAEWLGSSVCRWDPATGEILQRVTLPGTLEVTSCCFGGPNYDILYVTTASRGLTDEQMTKYPNSGKIFAVTNLGQVKGMPADLFDDSKL